MIGLEFLDALIEARINPEDRDDLLRVVAFGFDIDDSEAVGDKIFCQRRTEDQFLIGLAA